MATERQRRIVRAVTATIPRAPFLDAEAIREAARSRRRRSLSPEAAVWLAAEHTDYDALMDDGYDRDAARFFVADDINAVLDAWGARRHVDPADVSDEAEIAAENMDEDEDDTQGADRGA